MRQPSRSQMRLLVSCWLIISKITCYPTIGYYTKQFFINCLEWILRSVLLSEKTDSHCFPLGKSLRSRCAKIIDGSSIFYKNPRMWFPVSKAPTNNHMDRSISKQSRFQNSLSSEATKKIWRAISINYTSVAGETMIFSVLMRSFLGDVFF